MRMERRSTNPCLAALQAEKGGSAVEQAQTVRTQQKILRAGVAHDLRGGRIQPAGLDVLVGDVESELFSLAAIDGRGDEDVSFVGVHAPETGPVADDTAGCQGVHRPVLAAWYALSARVEVRQSDDLFEYTPGV